MQTPIRLTFRHIDHSAALEKRAHELLARIERFHRAIVDCHVVVEGPSAHHAKGAPFTVTVDLSLPGSTVHVNSAKSLRPSHEDPYVALRDAFDIAKRQLRDLTRTE